MTMIYDTIKIKSSDATLWYRLATYIVKGGCLVSQMLFEQYYRQVYQDLYRFAWYTLGNPQDVEDVASEAVTDTYQGFAGLKRQESFRPWMFKILTIKCKRKLKEYVNRPVDLEKSCHIP